MASRGPQRMEQPRRRATPRGDGDKNATTAPGARGAQPAATQRSVPLWRRLPIIFGAATGIGLCIVALVISLLFSHTQQPAPPDPTPVARSLCAALQAQDYATTYALLSARLRAEGTATQFAASQRRLDIQRGRVTSCIPTIQHTDAAQAAVNLALARGTTAAQTASVTLLYESGAWTVDAYDPALV